LAQNNTLLPVDYIGLGRSLMRGCRALPSFEAASQYICRTIYDRIRTINDVPLFALLRIYRLVRVDDLPAALRTLLDPGEKFGIALMGTYGKLSEWQDRSKSQGHRVIPINKVMIPTKIPMFERLLINDMEVDLKHLYSTGDVLASLGRPSGGTFLIEDAVTSPQIPVKDEFVIPHQIKSLVGFGGLVPDVQSRSTLYMLIGFTQIPVTPEIAKDVYSLQPYVAIGLDTTATNRIFS
jgi:hypothetical protein